MSSHCYSNSPKCASNVLDSIFNPIMRNINKTTKAMLNKIKPMLKKQNSVLPFGISKDPKDRKKSRALRRGQYGTLCLIVVSWSFAIVLGGTTMILDMSSSVNRDLRKTITYPASFLCCSNDYINQLASRYVVPMISVN